MGIIAISKGGSSAASMAVAVSAGRSPTDARLCSSIVTRGNASILRTTLLVKSDGTIWFTDPPYGILSDYEGYKAESELGDYYVFRFDPVSQELSVVTDQIDLSERLSVFSR